MSGLLINLIIQIVAGAIGGNVAGAASKDVSLGTAGNTIVQLVAALADRFSGHSSRCSPTPLARLTSVHLSVRPQAAAWPARS